MFSRKIENPFLNTVTYGIHQFHKFHSATGHVYLSRPIFVHRPSFDAWPRELQEEMRAAIKEGKAASGPAEQALNQSLQARQTELQRRSALLDAMQRGLVRPGWGHAARLQLMAHSIPASVWITHLKADDNQVEISGYTLEPAALNDWTTRLTASPTMQDQSLATIKVERASLARAGAAAAASAPVWSFNLVSALRQAAPGPSGSRP